MSVVSELVKGAKKGGAAGVVAVVLSLSAQADTGVPQGYTPANNDDAVGHTTISSSDTLDLSTGDGFSSTEKGEEVKQHTFAPSSSIVDLYRLKYGNVADAQTAYDNAVVAGASESELEGLQTALTQAQTIAAGISDEQFVVTGDVALLGSDTQGASRRARGRTVRRTPRADPAARSSGAAHCPSASRSAAARCTTWGGCRR